MSVPKLLIDGYNVLFQSQLVGRGRGPHWLQGARQRLVQLLSSRLTSQELETARIVFDAPKSGTMPQQTETLANGLEIVYALDHREADDLLEEIIRKHPTPKHLSVVSSDNRIRNCARARRAVSLEAEEFLDCLDRRPLLTSPPPEDNGRKASTAADEALLTADQIEYWLQEFGDDSATQS